MTTEFGVLSRYSNGATAVAGGMNRESAQRLVGAAADSKCWHPVAEAVVCRVVGDWVALDDTDAAS